WMRRKLQEARFQTANAGLEFYERLEGLYNTGSRAGSRAGSREAEDGQPVEALGAARREALEVYVTCLTLGFRGQYGDARGRSRVEQLTEANLQRVLADGGAPDRQLFPETYAAGFPAPAKSRFKPAVKALLFFGGPLLTAIGVYALYTYLLSAFVGQWAMDLGVPF
ncbi:MAG: DotU family type IV/VI secretion system protein, partial [Desulfatitalea sp.]|nr:DotU family type IV/VI secretion system protein [Desulfatitalea sp.]